MRNYNSVDVSAVTGFVASRANSALDESLGEDIKEVFKKYAETRPEDGELFVSKHVIGKARNDAQPTF